MLVKRLDLTDFKKEFAKYFGGEGAELLYEYLENVLCNTSIGYHKDETIAVLDFNFIKGNFDYVLFEELKNYEEDKINIVMKGKEGVLIKW